MEKLTINHRVKKEAEGSYYTVGFDVPPGIEKIRVSYQYNRFSFERGKTSRFMNVVDLGLEDANGRFLGWSGSARSSVSVGEFESTKGYLTTPIMPGNWKVIVGAYKVESQGVEVIYEITFEEKCARWVFGDLHMHSDASDGKMDIFQLATMAQKKRLDFIAVANHNNYSENLCLPHFPKLTFIPAVEWTHYLGHMNFFGAKVPFNNSFIANSPEQMHELIYDAKQSGAIISVNHPKCDYCPYLWEDDSCIDMVEIWNGPMRQANLRAIRWWTDLLQSGRKVHIAGGSDFHRRLGFARMGNPVTAVFTDSQSAEDILTALSKGHAYVTSAVSGVKLTLKCQGKSFGDTIESPGETVEILYRADNISRRMKLKLVTGEKTILLSGIRHRRSISGRVVVANSGFAYIVATKKGLFPKEKVCAISNPIYFVPKND